MTAERSLHLLELGMEIERLGHLLGITHTPAVSFEDGGLRVNTGIVAHATASSPDGKETHTIQHEATTVTLAVLGCANEKLKADQEYQENFRRELLKEEVPT